MVKIVDDEYDTPPLINHTVRYWLKTAFFAPVRVVPVGILP